MPVGIEGAEPEQLATDVATKIGHVHIACACVRYRYSDFKASAEAENASSY